MASRRPPWRCHRRRGGAHPGRAAANGNGERHLCARDRRGGGLRRPPLLRAREKRRGRPPFRAPIASDRGLRGNVRQKGAHLPQHHTAVVFSRLRRRARAHRRARPPGAFEPRPELRPRARGLGVQPEGAGRSWIRQDRRPSHPRRLAAVSRSRAGSGALPHPRGRPPEFSLRRTGVSQQAIRGSGPARFLLQEIRFRGFPFPSGRQGG